MANTKILKIKTDCEKCGKPLRLGFDGYRFTDKRGLYHDLCLNCFHKYKEVIYYG